MTKLLLSLFLSSATTAFATITWSCTSNLPASYLPSGCISSSGGGSAPSSNGDNTLPPSTTTSGVISKVVNYHAMFNGVDLATCIKSGNMGTPSGLMAMNDSVNSCLTGALTGMGSQWVSQAHCDIPTDMRSTTEIIDCYPAIVNSNNGASSGSVSIQLVSPQTAARYNGYYPNSSVQLPTSGAILCNRTGIQYNGGDVNDFSGCPSGSYAITYTPSTAGGLFANNPESIVFVP
ncbi:MAG: hypothetical protein E6Q32_08595 [Neisseriales bacterium]|nr:MAG: hypothetical protein E6Q32_08595 [Neisseriales bacterium]